MKTRIMIAGAVALVLLLAGGTALALAPAGYEVRWLVPLTGGGGAPASSAHYGVNLTIGQVAVASSSSAQYGVGLGFWYGVGGASVAAGHHIHLPVLLKNA